eukprot:scaffold254236_cov18-Prasinocladus_malaysianus.AAC.1
MHAGEIRVLTTHVAFFSLDIPQTHRNNPHVKAAVLERKHPPIIISKKVAQNLHTRDGCLQRYTRRAADMISRLTS